MQFEGFRLSIRDARARQAFVVWHRHVFANGSDCPVLASYQMWFGQKLLKKAKKTEMANFGATRSGFHKIAKSSLFYC